MILNLCGGEESEIVFDKVDNPKPKLIKYDSLLTKSFGGIDININDQTKILNKLGFKAKLQNNSKLDITVPPFRPDIVGPADIVEEIIRIYGYNKIESISLIKDENLKQKILNENLKSFYKSKRLIANCGYLETVTWSFMDQELANFIDSKNSLDLKNPISSDLSTMRSSTLPNLLSAINLNVSRLYNNGKLFEVGPNFDGINETDQKMVATGIHYGSANSSSWINQKRDVDIFDVKSDLFYILEQLNVPVENLQHEIFKSKVYHPGKSAQLRLGKNVIANFGEIHPLLLKKLDIKNVVCGFEIFLDSLEQFQIKKQSTKKGYNNNSLQIVERDFAFLLPKEINALDLINSIKKIDKKIIMDVIIFDIFEGNKLPENKKSIALKVTLQPQEKTFTDKEIEIFTSKIIDLIATSFKGELRQ